MIPNNLSQSIDRIELGGRDGVTLFKFNFSITEMRTTYLNRNITQCT